MTDKKQKKTSIAATIIAYMVLLPLITFGVLLVGIWGFSSITWISDELAILLSIGLMSWAIWKFLMYVSRSDNEKKDDQELTPDQLKIIDLETSLSNHVDKLRNLTEQFVKAIKTITELESKNAHLQKRNDTNSKVSQIKRAFAQKYHPDNHHSNGIEKLVREEIFKEFWEEIIAIEDDK
jgi:hypothetical protein